jgi:aspartyl-tRNA(Asn)/glutamyl-tRNA(Gln) amidotransferase subunit B
VNAIYFEAGFFVLLTMTFSRCIGRSSALHGAAGTLAHPNTTVSLFDCATPGTLPVINTSAVRLAVLAALLLKCKVNPVSFFDRKHYFYSDLPHGFQITQQRVPIAQEGEVMIPGMRVKVQRVQLEIDSGKMLHDRHAFASLVNLNRAGMPLIEIVSAPDMSNGEQAAAYAKTVQQLLRHVSFINDFVAHDDLFDPAGWGVRR